MSSTTKTTNYNLSQFADADKPTWRGDYNGDMLRIDRGMQCNANAAADAHTAATNAQNAANTNATAIAQVKATADSALSATQTNADNIAANESEFRSYKDESNSQLTAIVQRLDALDALVASKKTTPPEGWQVGSHVRAFHPAETTAKEFVASGVRVHYSQQTGNGVGTWCSSQDDDVLLKPGTYLFCLHSRITDTNVSDRTFRAYFGFREPSVERWTYPEDLYSDSYVAQLGSSAPAHEVHTQFVYECDTTTLVEVKYNIIGTGETVRAKIGNSALYVIRLNDGTGATRMPRA